MAYPTPPDYLSGYSPLQLETHPLAAPSPECGARWLATRARRRLMEGVWHLDLYGWAQVERHPALLAAMGNLDLSECLYESVVRQLAVLYEERPSVSLGSGSLPAQVQASLSRLFAAHQELNRAVLAYSEAAIVLDLQPASAADPTPRVVAACLALPDEIDAEPIAAGSRELATFRWAVRRRIGGLWQWCWDRWDLTGREPLYEVRLGEVAVPQMRLEGGAYLWRYADGRPFIPAVLYHAAEHGPLWRPYRWPELVRATLETAMNWSDWREGLRNAGAALRYALDAEVVGFQASGDGETATGQIPIAANSLVRFRTTGAQNTGSVGVLAAPIDPLQHAQAIALRHKLRAHSIGLHPSEIESHSTPDSGVALTIKREGQRRYQRAQEPNFRLGDTELLDKWAALQARLGAATIPAGQSWTIRYSYLPETPAEAERRRQDEAHDLDRGLTSRARILAERNHTSLEEGETLAAQIQAEQAADAPPAPEEQAPGAHPSAHQALPLHPPPPRPELPEHPYAGQLDYQGLHVLVETAAGQTRSGVDPDGKAWSVTMPAHYGEVAGTLGLDGDPVDVMVGPDPAAPDVYVLHLRRPGSEVTDEDKGYLGFASMEEALACFRLAYTRQDILQGVTRWPIAAFRAFLLDPNKQGYRLDAPPGSGLEERAPESEGSEQGEEPEEP